MANVAQGFVGLITQIITSVTGLFLMNLGYLLFGSYIFYVLESPHESQLVSDLADRRQELIGKLHDLVNEAASTKAFTTSPKDSIGELRRNASIFLANYEAKLADFYRKRAVLNINDETGSNATGQTKLWTPLGAIIYSYSVITTIGWGNIVPGTDNGKIVTIIYGIFGIPLLFALSSQTGSMVANFNLRLWKLIQGIFKVTSRLIGFNKIDKENEDDDESDSDDDNDNRKRDRSGSNASPLFDWNFPPEYGHVSEAEILERVKIQQKLAQRIIDVSKDVKRKTTYLKTTESTVNFLLDMALNPARDLGSILPSTLPHKRILNQEDVPQLVFAFDSMDFSELKLCVELVGVPSEMFRELLCKGKPGGIMDSAERSAKLIEPQSDSPKLSVVTVGTVNGDAEKCDSRVKVSLSGNGAASGEILERHDINTHQIFDTTEFADAIHTTNEKSEIVRSHVMTGDPEKNILPSNANVQLEANLETKTINSEVIMHGLKTIENVCDDDCAKQLPNNERVISEDTLRNPSTAWNEDLILQNREIKSALEEHVIDTGASLSMRVDVKENGDNEQEMIEAKIQKLAQLFSKVFEVEKQSLVPSVHGVDVTKKPELVHGVQDVDVTKPHNLKTTLRRHVEERKQKRKTKRERNFVSGRVQPGCNTSSVESIAYTNVEPAGKTTGVVAYTKIEPASKSTGVGIYTKVEPCRRSIDEDGPSIANSYSREVSFLDEACSRHSLADSLKVQAGSRIDDGKAEQDADNPRGYRNGRRKKKKNHNQNRERSREKERKMCNHGQISNNEQNLHSSTNRQTISEKRSFNIDTLDDTAGLGTVDAMASNPTEINHHFSSYCTGERNRIVADFKGRGRPDRRTRSDAKSKNHMDMCGVTHEGDRENFQVNARNPSDGGGETTIEDASQNGAAGDSNLCSKPPSKLGVLKLSKDCLMPSICIELARTGCDLEFNELSGEPACTNERPFNTVNGVKSGRKSRKVNSGKEPLKPRHSRHTSSNRVKNFDFSTLHARMGPYAPKTSSVETTGNHVIHLVGHKPRIHCVKEKVPTTGQSEVDVNQSADFNVNFKELFGVSDEPDDDEVSFSISDSDSEYSDRGDSEDDDKVEQKGGESSLPLSVLYLFVMIYILLGALTYYHFTQEPENKFLNWIYFIYVTLSTTGFGDILPEEHMLLFTAVYGLLGMAIFNVLLNATLETFISGIDYINVFNVGTEEDDASDES